MRRRFLNRKKHRKEDLELQITSLADVLIIVLVFLLKSVSASIEDIETVTIPSTVKLPVTINGNGATGGIKIEISERMVSVGGKPVSSLSRFRFFTADLNHDLENGGSSRSLNQALARAKSNEKSDESKAWIIADQRAPYSTIQTVMASAALNGYSDFKLAVVRDE